VFDLARAAGLGPLDPGVLQPARALLLHTATGIGMVVTVTMAVAAAIVLARAHSADASLVGLVLLGIAVLGVSAGGHATSAIGGPSALVGRALHLFGVSAWVGGLLALLLLWPALWRDRLAGRAARGFSVLAGGPGRWSWPPGCPPGTPCSAGST